METTSDSIPEIDGETSPPTRNVESEDFPESGKMVPERSGKVGSGDLPISGESGFMVVESENSLRKKKWILVYGVVGAFVILLVIITVLAAMLARCSSRNESNNNTATEKTTNNVPTLNLQDKIKQVKEHIVSQGYSSSDDVQKESTPQDLAAQFMGLDDIAVPHKTSSKGETFEWMERYVMTVFYYAMNGDSWVVSNSFVNRNIRTCRWVSPIFQEGVGCDKNGRINSISLERNNLKGTIPSELGLLDYLISFSAADNSISGPIPAWIGKLSTLRYLHLYGNQITGSIPTSINELNSLIALSLEDNAMTGDLNHITGLRNLAFLFLEDNGFSQKVDSSFLTNLPSLKVLDISDNDFSGAVPVHLFSDGGLNVFDVHGNYLDSFPDAIPDNSTLKFLSMHMNPLSGTFPSTTISSLKNLEHLDLTSTKLEGTMPEELGNVKTLEYLFLADTSFTAGSIPDTFQNLTALVDLSLKHSGRTGMIPSWIHVLKNLVLLDLDSNNLAGGVPREIGNLTDLTFLFLHRNNLEGTVPEELGMAKSLSYLFLDHNSLSGSLDPICNQLTRLRSSTSDCGYPNIEIDCTCCRVCCDDDNVTEACTEIAEHDFLMSLDPHWSTDYKRFEPLKGHTVYYINDFNITRRS
mmetsp:Transcript_31416/g.46325  ORF Transcript_31416/g.46325 Transcript_31416/m.46325 type:complete len:639 (+) Transcript_31416:352-2268(+)